MVRWKKKQKLALSADIDSDWESDRYWVDVHVDRKPN